MAKAEEHELPDCLHVWYCPLFFNDEFGDVEEICEQGWADLKFDGINGALAKKIWRAS